MESMDTALERLTDVNGNKSTWKDGAQLGWHKVLKYVAAQGFEWQEMAGRLYAALERLGKECKCPMFFGYKGECSHMAPGEFVCRNCAVFGAYSALEEYNKAKPKE